MHLRNDGRTIIIYNCERSEPVTRVGWRISLVYILVKATALGSRIPPHAVLLQVNDNTPLN